MSQKRILLCMGTRPEIIKMAPVYHALQGSPLTPVVVHTGQHEEMAWPVYEFFEMDPAHVITLKRERSTLGYLGGRLMDGVDAVIASEDAEAVLVHGDTSSALMAGLAASYAQIPVGHVEAGLRSHDMSDPFPEEQNRVLLAQIARWHFAPTERAVDNLTEEGIARDGIDMVGNTIVDATRLGMDYAISHYAGGGAVEGCDVAPFVKASEGSKIVLVTAHRRENWGAPLARIAHTVRELAETHPELRVVWPVHANPVVRKTVIGVMKDLAPDVHERVLLTGPLNYPQMLWTLRNAWLTITDSGGIQEEAAALRVPVLVTRKTTERPELIEAGGGALVATDPGKIRRWVETLLEKPIVHSRMRTVRNPYGDGHAGQAIARVLVQDLAGSQRVIRAA
ncbi:MAG: UDP-N-acetylglucosamine 2-epimerase (non-hydrolyzing) [Rhodothermales bacterium]|nr:UDP-N-acetylglucosamine 2-epimerase (non-hydrolyzing) [Rhodothermales bacterium]MBO6778192.1 UDP-N-acetylglucosamine 2-epimerase (non-hydrolyzing) [Rhodothermales bacterium]